MPVPIIFGKPIQIWLGMILAIFLAFQIFSGFMVIRGRVQYMRRHKINVWFVIIIVLAHIYFGVRMWFF
jgi:threonine/homoserine/homoserine lactone efflux protein